MVFDVSMRHLLEAGVHFGHQTKRWDPRMKPFIYTARNDIHVIDLKQSLERLEAAYNFVLDLVSNGGKVLFVGTKKQAQDAVKEEALRCKMPFVTNRWLGGALTNLSTIRKSVRKYKKLLEQREKGIFEKLPTKEVSKLTKEMVKLETNLGGILEMTKLPEAIFVVDTVKENIAVHEARRLGIKVVAIVDTNSNPRLVDVPIPGNDDAIRAVKLIAQSIANACNEGTKTFIEKNGGTYEENAYISADDALEAVAAIEKEEAILETEAIDKEK
ncbi:30S ribosomal protein S2 [Candidatus Termititenax dinenymphae]|uniref:Small ribosomal subunit protein uS2 n=1 Tax=Candidatus Termititenax dinenymphae TaxID=2218523 RepID=A0A388TJG6_9BACT|nr:30S ribosomal protein S2 [Candidatus Termititenax dinenymphae]